MAKVQTARARVLSDHVGLGIKHGQIVEGPEPVIKALATAGAVDNHEDAVAYAASKGAELIALEDPAAAAEVAAAVIEEKQADAADASQASAS
jgi:phosphosulfolactate phosphohydrolase-like enzyme